MVPEPWFSKVAENCIGTDVSMNEKLSAIQRSSYIITLSGLLKKLQLSALCFIEAIWETWDFVRSGISIVIQFHILSFFPIANMYLVL